MVSRQSHLKFKARKEMCSELMESGTNAAGVHLDHVPEARYNDPRRPKKMLALSKKSGKGGSQGKRL